MSIPETEGQHVPAFKLMPGGKGSKNWLWFLPKGAVFLAKGKGLPIHPEILGYYQLVEKTTKAVVLFRIDQQQRVFVDPVLFSDNWDMYELIALLGKEDDGTGDPIQPGGMEDHADD